MIEICKKAIEISKKGVEKLKNGGKAKQCQ